MGTLGQKVSRQFLRMCRFKQILRAKSLGIPLAHTSHEKGFLLLFFNPPNDVIQQEH